MLPTISGSTYNVDFDSNVGNAIMDAVPSSNNICDGSIMTAKQDKGAGDSTDRSKKTQLMLR